MAQTQYANTEVFLNQLRENEVAQQYQDEAVFLKEIVEKKPGKMVNSKGLEITAEFSPDTSVANVSDGGANPPGGNNTYAKMYVGFVHQRGTVDITLDQYDGMNAGKESSLVSVAEKIARVNAAQFREQEEQCWGLGDGVKAVVGSGSTTTSIVLTTTPTTTPMTSKGSQFLYPGRAYDLYDSSGTLRQANITLTAVTPGSSPTATPNVTLSVTPSSTDVLVGKGGYNKAARGIPYLLANGSGLKQGLLQSSYPALKSPQEDLAGANLQPSTILRLKNKVRYRGGVKAGKGLMICGSIAQIEAYNRTGFNFLQLGMGQTYEGVVQNSTMAGQRPMELTTCDEDTLSFINGDDLFRIENRPYGFIKTGDGLTFRQKQGSNGTGANAIYANVGVDWNLYVKKPNSHGRIIRASVTGVATEAGSW